MGGEREGTEGEHTPPRLREDTRSGIFAAIARDVEMRGGRTARLLVAAGVCGVAGAVGLTLLISGHPFDHHPSWHVVVFSAVWAGLLVVSFALALLEVRTPTYPLARAALVGILGLGLAGICGAVCPDQHFLRWWSMTGLGEPLTSNAGPAVGALCFGLAMTLVVATTSAFLLLGDAHRPVRSLLPAAALFLLLAPGVALQSVGTSFGVFSGWIAGTAAGAYVGIATGKRLRALFARSGSQPA